MIQIRQQLRIVAVLLPPHNTPATQSASTAQTAYRAADSHLPIITEFIYIYQAPAIDVGGVSENGKNRTLNVC